MKKMKMTRRRAARMAEGKLVIASRRPPREQCVAASDGEKVKFRICYGECWKDVEVGFQDEVLAKDLPHLLESHTVAQELMSELGIGPPLSVILIPSRKSDTQLAKEWASTDGATCMFVPKDRSSLLYQQARVYRGLREHVKVEARADLFLDDEMSQSLSSFQSKLIEIKAELTKRLNEENKMSGKLQSSKTKLEQELRTCQTKLEGATARVNTLQNQLEQTMDSRRRFNSLLKRILLDGVRSKLKVVLAERWPDVAWSRYRWWNDLVEQLQSSNRYLPALALTAEDVQLTKYGEGSCQEEGNRAAHHASLQELAVSVCSETGANRAAFLRLFTFLTGDDAELLAFSTLHLNL